jgi:hypothetical protein
VGGSVHFIWSRGRIGAGPACPGSDDEDHSAPGNFTATGDACSPVDDAKKVIAEFKAAVEQANVSAAELVSAPEHLVAIVTRPSRPELVSWKRLPVEQALFACGMTSVLAAFASI